MLFHARLYAEIAIGKTIIGRCSEMGCHLICLDPSVPLHQIFTPAEVMNDQRKAGFSTFENGLDVDAVFSLS